MSKSFDCIHRTCLLQSYMLRYGFKENYTVLHENKTMYKGLFDATGRGRLIRFKFIPSITVEHICSNDERVLLSLPDLGYQGA